MQDGLLEFLPIWAVFVVTLLVVLFAVEGGYRLARRKRKNIHEEEKEAPVGAVVGATLGLLAFLLAITFGQAADRYGARKAVLVDEVNAIGSAYLYADLLPQKHRTEVRQILREYVDDRLHWGGVANARADHSTAELQQQLWSEAVAISDLDRRDTVIPLFVASISDVVNLQTKRLYLRDLDKIPGAFWLVLYVVAFLSLGTMGYHAGLARARRSPTMLAIAIAFSAVMVLIADIDRPGAGSIKVNQQVMLDLRDSMAAAKP